MVVGTVRTSSLPVAEASGLPYHRLIGSDEFPDALIDQRFDVVIDPVGGELRTTSLDVMAPLGRLLAVGNASGDWRHSVGTNRLWVSNLALLGFSGGSYLPPHPESVHPAAAGALKAVSEGLVNRHTDRLPLEQAAEAHRRVEAGQVNGRILLVPWVSPVWRRAGELTSGLPGAIRAAEAHSWRCPPRRHAERNHGMPSARDDLEYQLATAGEIQAPAPRLARERAAHVPGQTTMRIGFRTVDGVRIRYARSDGPSERTLLLTSPWPESLYAFAPIWLSLAQRFRLFAVDLPGFGASERRNNLLSPQAMGSFLVRLIAECELGRPHIVGPDIGTSAALFAAVSSPRSVASVVVGCGGAAVPIELGEPLKGWALEPDLDRFRSMDPCAVISAALETVEGHIFPPAIREDYLACYAGDRFVESMRYVRRYPDDLPLLAQRLPEIETPALIFAGVHDQVVPLANAEFLATHLPNCRLAMISAGHFVWEEAPDAYAAMLANWVMEGWLEVGHDDRSDLRSTKCRVVLT